LVPPFSSHEVGPLLSSATGSSKPSIGEETGGATTADGVEETKCVEPPITKASKARDSSRANFVSTSRAEKRKRDEPLAYQ